MQEKRSNTDCVLQAPTNKNIIDTPLAQFWFDGDILYSVSKKGLRGLEELKETLAIIRSLVGNNKTCLIADTSNTQYYTIEMREELTRVFVKLFKAVALLPCSPMGKIMANILFMREKGLQAKVFNNIEEAKQWIREYL
jgi:hypothetical protein